MRQSEDFVYWLDDALYLNITNRCSNNCYFCFKHYWSGIAGFKLKLSSEPSVEQIIEDLKKHIFRRRWRETVFCGFGEPTARLDCLLEVAKWINEHFPFLSIRLDTNGHAFLLNPKRDVIGELKDSGVRAVSVSINGHDEETYNKICRPVFTNAYRSAIEFVKSARDASLDVEITAVMIPEIDISRIQDLASRLKVKFRARDYIPCFY
ncbi:MAG: TatD family nuclease-associated radical SAM protein [Candidatus Bathyarchaeota archaeon]|nr:TatD family nuclease-associated radical SAM protein [Candidatus Bathyarchaeota archaeon]